MTVVITGPLPAPGRSFCTICAAAWKAAWIAAHQAEIEAAGEGAVLDLGDAGGGVYLELAVGFGLTMLPVPPPAAGSLPVLAPLCWNHLQPVKFLDSALAVGTAGQVPTGPGGAADLSQRRRG